MKEEIRRKVIEFLESGVELPYKDFEHDGNTWQVILMRLNYLQHLYKLETDEEMLESLINRTCDLWPGYLMED